MNWYKKAQNTDVVRMEINGLLYRAESDPDVLYEAEDIFMRGYDGDILGQVISDAEQHLGVNANEAQSNLLRHLHGLLGGGVEAEEPQGVLENV